MPNNQWSTCTYVIAKMVTGKTQVQWSRSDKAVQSDPNSLHCVLVYYTIHVWIIHKLNVFHS